MADGTPTTLLPQRSVVTEFICNSDTGSGSETARVTLGAAAEQLSIILTGNIVKGYATRAALYGDLSALDGTSAVVYADPTTAYNGSYVKVGAAYTGYWQYIGSNSDAITADVISADRAVNNAYRFTIQGQDGSIALGVSADGRLKVIGVDVQPPASTRSTARRFVSLFTSVTGSLLTADRNTGALVFTLSPYADTYLPPSTMRGTHSHYNIRPDGTRGIAATAQDADGYADDIYQRRDVVTNAAVAVGAGRLEIVGMLGQSNAGAGSGAVGGPLWTGHKFPHHTIMLELGCEIYGSASEATNPYRPPYDFGSLAEPTGYGQAPIGTATEAIAQIERDAGFRNPTRVAQTVWEGSQPLTNFFPGSSGHYLHENFVYQLNRIKTFAAQYPLTSVSLPAVILVQGEAGPYPYASTLGSWIDTVLPLYATTMGQSATPKLLYMQINAATSGSASGVELDQVLVARSRTSPAVSLVGPMYAYPVHDGIHLTDLGRMMMGENIAVAYDRVVRQGFSWNPLWPVSGGVTRSSNVITIPMTLPPGCSQLLLDSDWVQTVTNKGFVFSQTGGNSPTIQSVAVSGTNIVVTLDVAPTGTSKKISYAMNNNSGTTGWATGRGQVYSPDTRTSVFYRRGYQVPQLIRHYCVRFEESLS